MDFLFHNLSQFDKIILIDKINVQDLQRKNLSQKT